MKRIIPIVCLFILFCSGQAAPQVKQEPTADQIQAFFRAVEDGRGDIDNWWKVDWAKLQPLAAEQNISEQMSLESWSQFVKAAAKTGLKSRMVLQAHPLLKQRPYFDEFVHVLGYDSDLFTRFLVFVTMDRLYPDDPRTPKFGLLLLLDAWNGKWPDGIDLRGNSPRDQLQLEVGSQWEGPRPAPNGQGSEGTFGSEILPTPERCAQLLSQSDKWVFDSTIKKWKAKK
jgi:hypothetical protein